MNDPFIGLSAANEKGAALAGCASSINRPGGETEIRR